MRPRRRLLFAAVVVLVAACGSRTGLLVPEDFEKAVDASDASVVRHHDVFIPPEEDAFDEMEALPPLDVTPPPPDSAIPSDCVDAGATLIYLISVTNNLFSFDPPTATFTQIGTIACPTLEEGATPFSMAVDRKGIAYIVFDDGELFRVSTANAACVPTGFVVGQQGFASTYGMGFSQDNDGGETLYVASSLSTQPAQPAQLATIDVLNGFNLHVVGDLTPINLAELTGTGSGGLFAFWAPTGNSSVGSAISQLDKTTGQETNQSSLPTVEQGNGWAFAFWGGDFYTFTAPGTSTFVNRFNPNDGTVVQVATTNDEIVGAGVSTCAPQQ